MATDLEAFQALLYKARTSFDMVPRSAVAGDDNRGWTPSPACTSVIRVMPGYRAHFEAAFDKDGNILSIGQWEEL